MTYAERIWMVVYAERIWMVVYKKGELKIIEEKKKTNKPKACKNK